MLLVCIIRSALIGWLRRGRGAATAIAFGIPLILAAVSSALAYVASDTSDPISSGFLVAAVGVFFLMALVVGALGVALSKLVRGEFSVPRS